MVRICFIFLFLLGVTDNSSATVSTKIVDVGAERSAIVASPSNQYFVFDAGNWRNQLCFSAVKSVVSPGKIALPVLSHSDADHIGNASQLLEEFEVDIVGTTGQIRTSKTWKLFDASLSQAKRNGTQVISPEGLTGIFQYKLSFEPLSVDILYVRS